MSLLNDKSREAIPKDVINKMGLIAINRDNLRPFGSWTIPSELYFGDVDYFEKESRQGENKSEVLGYYARKLQEIIRNVFKRKDVFLGDIKAGWDRIFKLKHIGKLKFDAKGKFKVIDYNATKLKAELSDLLKRKLLTKKEFIDMIKYVTPKQTQLEHETLFNLLRDKWLLRWSGNEILKGIKLLPGGRSITLKQALDDPTLTKIDMWLFLFGRWIEATNIYILYYVDEDGKIELLNYTKEPVELLNELKREVEKFAFRKLNDKPLKMLKRIRTLARFLKDNEMMKKITPFMQSDVARISQITTDLTVISDILKNAEVAPLETLLLQLDYVKDQIANIFELDIKKDLLYKAIDNLTRKKKDTPQNRNIIINELSIIVDFLNAKGDETTKKWLKKNNLFPPPARFLPN